MKRLKLTTEVNEQIKANECMKMRDEYCIDELFEGFGIEQSLYVFNKRLLNSIIGMHSYRCMF